jgi:hypothetical protein
LQAAFLARALNAVTSLALELDNRELGDATGAPSDYGVLLRALEGPEAVRLLQGRDPLAAARLRGLEARARLLRVEGEPLSVDEVAKALHVTRQAVDKRRRAGKLIGLDTGRRGYLYPRWQIGPDGMLPGLEETLTHLGVRDPWMQAAFFVSGSTYLDGETPVAALRSGRLRDVVRAAAAYGEQGAA